MQRTRVTALVALTLLAGLLGAPAATAGAPSIPPDAAADADAGTIVFLKQHNVYVARPDGTGVRRVTSDGTAARPWRSPSGTDNGLIVAARGTRVYRMDQWGIVLNSFDPPDLVDSGGDRIGGAVAHAVVSPDGARIAYTYRHHTCPPRGACRLRWATAVSAASRLTSPYDLGVNHYENPSWVTPTRLLLNGVGYDSIHVFDLAAGARFWFHDAQPTTDYHPLFEPVVSRDGAMFAAVRGEGDQAHIVTASVTGNIRSGPTPTWPTYRCGTSAAAGFGSPTFASDGSALAWQEADGIWVKPAPLDCDLQPALAIPGGSAPHWTPAALQGTRPDHPTPIGRFALVGAPTLKTSGVPRVGKRLRATSGSWTPAPSRIRFQWLRDGRPIKRATAASYRLKRADRAHRISVRITAQRSDYRAAVATTRRVKVRR